MNFYKSHFQLLNFSGKVVKINSPEEVRTSAPFPCQPIALSTRPPRPLSKNSGFLRIFNYNPRFLDSLDAEIFALYGFWVKNRKNSKKLGFLTFSSKFQVCGLQVAGPGVRRWWWHRLPVRRFGHKLVATLQQKCGGQTLRHRVDRFANFCCKTEQSPLWKIGFLNNFFSIFRKISLHFITTRTRTTAKRTPIGPIWRWEFFKLELAMKKPKFRCQKKPNFWKYKCYYSPISDFSILNPDHLMMNLRKIFFMKTLINGLFARG